MSKDWDHPERVADVIGVGDIVLLAMYQFEPQKAKIIREPTEGDELWYIEFISDDAKLNGVRQAINAQSRSFERFVLREKYTKDA